MSAAMKPLVHGRRLVLRSIWAQTQAELTLTARRGENVLITVIVPVLLLVFFASLDIVRVGTTKPINFLLPGMLALAVIATGMVALGIATAYERYYGVLKRLGASPLPRAGLIAAKALSVLALEVVQITLLMIVAAILYGWHLDGSVATLLLALLLGSLAFAAVGLAMAGALRAEATLAGANGLYLLFLLLSDAVLPLDHLPTVLQDLAHVLPAAALTDALRAALTAGAAFPGSDLAVLAVWAIVMLAVAIRTFKWE
ncbi:MAG TPA: ABC transporter permease [Chloroflexota bacterium]|nr:ABC transporter permease [Chloroflexota bacterium]